MKEIERIIADHMKNTEYEEARLDFSEQLAKAIEQYVIKAKIEELENLCSAEDIVLIDNDKVELWQRIAQLKKGLE